MGIVWGSWDHDDGWEGGKSPKDLRSIIELGGPFDLAAVAFSVVGCHVCYDSCGMLEFKRSTGKYRSG